ncbi:MAG: hypothetical protein GY933_16505 [Hyphomicrobiales bacterium]|nr:hypothetical protein [Hyphomicrobiales bacterium]
MWYRIGCVFIGTVFGLSVAAGPASGVETSDARSLAEAVLRAAENYDSIATVTTGRKLAALVKKRQGRLANAEADAVLALADALISAGFDNETEDVLSLLDRPGARLSATREIARSRVAAKLAIAKLTTLYFEKSEMAFFAGVNKSSKELDQLARAKAAFDKGVTALDKLLAKLQHRFAEMGDPDPLIGLNLDVFDIQRAFLASDDATAAAGLERLNEALATFPVGAGAAILRFEAAALGVWLNSDSESATTELIRQLMIARDGSTGAISDKNARLANLNATIALLAARLGDADTAIEAAMAKLAFWKVFPDKAGLGAKYFTAADQHFQVGRTPAGIDLFVEGARLESARLGPRSIKLVDILNARVSLHVSTLDGVTTMLLLEALLDDLDIIDAENTNRVLLVNWLAALHRDAGQIKKSTELLTPYASLPLPDDVQAMLAAAEQGTASIAEIDDLTATENRKYDIRSEIALLKAAIGLKDNKYGLWSSEASIARFNLAAEPTALSTCEWLMCTAQTRRQERRQGARRAPCRISRAAFYRHAAGADGLFGCVVQLA